MKIIQAYEAAHLQLPAAKKQTFSYIKVIDKTIYGNVICKWWPCGILTKNLASFLLIKLKSLSTRTDQAGSPKGSGTVESFLYLCRFLLSKMTYFFIYVQKSFGSAQKTSGPAQNKLGPTKGRRIIVSWQKMKFYLWYVL